MQRFAFFFTSFLLVSSCNQWRFDSFAIQFWKAHNTVFSITAASGIPDSSQLKQREIFLLKQTEAFYAFDQSTLEPTHQQEWNKIAQELASRKKELEQLRSDPSLYNIGGRAKVILANAKTPLNQRLTQIDAQLAKFKSYYDIAKANLRHPDIEKTQLAIRKQLLTLQFLQTELTDSLNRSTFAEPQQQKIVQHRTQAQIAVKDYIAFCRSIIFEHNDSTFSLK